MLHIVHHQQTMLQMFCLNETITELHLWNITRWFSNPRTQRQLPYWLSHCYPRHTAKVNLQSLDLTPIEPSSFPKHSLISLIKMCLSAPKSSSDALKLFSYNPVFILTESEFQRGGWSGWRVYTVQGWQVFWDIWGLHEVGLLTGMRVQHHQWRRQSEPKKISVMKI